MKSESCWACFELRSSIPKAQLVEHMIRPGPSTVRPFVSINEMAKFFDEHKVDSSPITTSDGRLVGLILQRT